MRQPAARAATFAFLLAVLGACGDSTGPDPGPAWTYLGATVAIQQHNMLAAEVIVRAVGFDSVYLRYSNDSDRNASTPMYSFGPDSTARPALLGMAANSLYDVEVILAGPGEVAVDTFGIWTGSLPSWIPTVTPVGTDTTPGFLLISIPDGPVIYDNSGTVVWYQYHPDGTLVNTQNHPSGIYTSFGLNDEIRSYQILDELGRETARLGCVEYETRPHEVRVLEDGRALLLCDDYRTEDLSPYGGSPTGEVNWTVVQLVSEAGELEWEWHSADHFQVGDTPQDDLNGVEALNLTHGNAIDVDTDGNYLISFRNLNEITKVDATTGDVIWRLGGRRNEFAFVGDPKGSFERQHGLRVVGPGEIQFLDNSDLAPSRLVRFKIDESQRTAELMWAYSDGPDIHTLVGGSTQVFGDGGALVSFGREGRVVEVSPAGTRRWELTGIDGLYVFRAERIPSLYAVERREEP